MSDDENTGEELLEYSRYGEAMDLEVLLTTGGVDVNYADDGGNTALHKAAANGHLECVEILIRYSAKYTKNLSGNTPLHWAAMNGNLKVVALLMKAFKEVDVLEKNGFGQGALSEAFRSGNTELITLLLEHPTSSEEKLMSKVELGAYIGKRLTLANLSKEDMNGRPGVCVGVEETRLLVKLDPLDPSSKPKTVKVKHKNIVWQKEEDDEEGVVESSGDRAEVEHQFRFSASSDEVLKIRECAMERADSPFQTSEEYDATGLSIWCASLIMARWVADSSDQGAAQYFKDKTMVELGAGVGASGLSACLYAKPSLAVLTDLHEGTLANLRHNASLLPPLQGEVRVESLSWGCDASDVAYDVVMGSDLVYCQDIAPLLASTVDGLLKPNGLFLYCCPAINGNGRAGLDSFLTEQLQQNFGFELLKSQVAPQSYAENPLSNGDATACFLHFSELGLPYALHVFRKSDRIVPSVPNGHTSYSWGRFSRAGMPRGHSPYSWGADRLQHA